MLDGMSTDETVRARVRELAIAQATDEEIEAALAAEELHRMTAVEIHEARELRLAGRGELRTSISEMLREPPQIARAKVMLDATFERIEEKLLNDEYTHTELVRLARFLAQFAIVPRAAALASSFEAGRQYLGFTAKGFDDDMRTELEKAELLASADREERRRREEESMH